MAAISSYKFHHHVSNNCMIDAKGQRRSDKTYHVIAHGHKQIKESATRLQSVGSISEKKKIIQFAANLHLHLHGPTSLECRPTSDD